MMNKTRTVLHLSMMLITGLLTSTASAKTNTSSTLLNRAQQKVVCQRKTTKADKQLCMELCTSRPLSKTCRVSLRFGSKGVQFLNKAQKDARYQRNIERNAVADFKFSADEARRLRWYLTTQMGFFDPNDPTRDKRYVSINQKRAVINALSEVKSRTTLAQKAQQMDKVVQIAAYTYGANSISMQRIYQAAAMYNKLAGQMGKARQWMKQSYNIAARHLPVDHPNRANIEMLYAKLLIELGDIRPGTHIMTRAFERIEALYDGYDEQNITARKLLARTLITQGAYDKALPLYALNVRDLTILGGQNNKALILAHADLARVYQSTGNLLKAREAYAEAMKLLTKLKLNQDTTAIRIWHGMGDLELRAGQFSAQLARKAKSAKKQKRLNAQANEAFLLAQQYLTKAQSIFKNNPTIKDTHHQATLMHQRGHVYQALGEPKKSLVLHMQALEINRKVYGAQAIKTLTSQMVVDNQRTTMGMLEPALKSLQALLAIKTLPISMRADIELRAGKIAMILGQDEQAKTLLVNAAQRHHQQLNQASFIHLSHHHMNHQYALKRPALDWALATMDPQSTESWKLLAKWQGLITKQAMYKHLEARVRRRVPSAQQGNYEQWRYHFMKSNGQSAQAKSLSKGLAKTVPGFAQLLEPVDKREQMQTICKTLKAKKANLLHFSAVVRHSVAPQTKDDQAKPRTMDDLKSTAHYRADVLTQDCKHQTVDLGPKAKVDQQIKAYEATVRAAERCYAKRGAALCSKTFGAMRQASQGLHEQLWAKVVGQHNATHWYVVPDGKLGKVNFDGLTTPKGQYLIEQTSITLLPYPSALMETRTHLYRSSNALVVGDIDYKNAASLASAQRMAKYCDSKGCKAQKQTAPHTSQKQSKPSSRAAQGQCAYNSKWASLKTEAGDVAKFIGAQPKWGAMLLTGQAASEAMLRHTIHKHRIVHLATHGFFANRKSCQRAMLLAYMQQQHKAGKSMEPDISSLNATVVAGVNARANALDDGLLEGSEVAALDLDQTELVVLSACETGLGIEIEGQGILGLAQGYQLAGAQHTIASLWRVPSNPTSELFRDFYKHWLKDKKTVDQALKSAKVDAIKRWRKQGIKDSAFLWSAFQLTSFQQEP